MLLHKLFFDFEGCMIVMTKFHVIIEPKEKYIYFSIIFC